MQKYGNERNSPSDAKCVVRILVSFVVILISVAAIYVVVLRVMDIQILGKINIKEEPHDSLNIVTDSENGTSMFITDEKGLKFKKEDKSFARDEWVEKNGELFYFDTAGYGINSDLKIDGQVYTFENGKLKMIKRDTSYVGRARDDLYSSVETTQYLVWLSSDEKDKGFYPIMYHQYSDDFEDYLGTSADKQYASPNMIKIYMSNIYYLAVGKGTSYAGRLYRMRPGAIHKETVGVGVTGFIVLSDDVVYYCDGSKILKAKSWKGVELKLPDDEELTDDGEIISKIATVSDLSDLAVDISELPVPDTKVEKEIATVSDIKKKVSTENKSQKETVKVEIGVSPDGETKATGKPQKVEVIDKKAPVVVEYDAPR